MSGLLNKIKQELKQLIDEKDEVVNFDAKGNIKGVNKLNYQIWYSRALPVVKQLIPERYNEFLECYKLKINLSAEETNAGTYTISNFMNNIIITRGLDKKPIFNTLTVFSEKFLCQMGILHGAAARLDSVLTDITGVLRVELFDNELDAAIHLLKNGHFRAAGAVAGVVLEGHLKSVCVNHEITIKKKDPGISNLNDLLKKEGIYDVPTWRKIQTLMDIRNYCDHKKDRDPKKEEVEELIDNTKKIIKIVF